MFATCITELINLNVVLASTGAHILKMDESEVPSGGLIMYYFCVIPPLCAYFLFTAAFNCGCIFCETENVFVSSALAGLSWLMRSKSCWEEVRGLGSKWSIWHSLQF